VAKIPDKLRSVLDETGIPWALESGAKHYKIKLAGKLVGILPHSRREPEAQDLRNTIAQVRRAAQLALS
jgi:hypothetical protein